jgi:cellobiose transport system permease protein
MTSRSSGARRVGFSQRLSRWDVRLSPYLYVSPFFLLFAVVGLFPLLYTAWVSLHDWHLIGGQGEMVGLENFSAVLHDRLFWIALRNTFSIFLLSSVPQIMIAVVLAAMLNANLRTKTLWRMGVLLPYIVAPVAVGLIFSKVFADQSGLANALLDLVGIDPVAWHASPLASHIAIATMVNFRWIGYNTLILLAAMQAIPTEMYEASVLDGAGRIRQFFSITVPLVRPTMIFVIVTSTIAGLQIFDEPRMFDQWGQGGSDRQWMTVTMYLYEVGWGAQKSFGRASAIAWLLFLVIIAIAIVNFLLTSRIASADGARKRAPKNRAARRAAGITAGATTTAPETATKGDR